MKTKFNRLSACIVAIVFSLGSSLGQAATNTPQTPPNTLDLGGGTSSSVVAAYAPPNIAPQIVPSTRSMISEQVSQFQQMQLTPEEAQTIKQLRLQRQRIEATPYLTAPEPVVRSLAIQLEPGKIPPLLRVSKNMLTSVVFTDIDGNPWYIEKVALNRSQFSDAVSSSAVDSNVQLNNQNPQMVQQNGQSQPMTGNSPAPTEPKLTNILTLEPNDAIAYGNVSVTLKGKELPVIFMVTAGQNEVDIRVDARVPGANPDAKPKYTPSPVQVSTGIDEAALSFLDGVIPADAETLIASDPAAQAWNYNGSLYVKTRLDVIYPAYTAKASTRDSVNVYRFSDTLPNNSVTLSQRGGQPVTVSFEEAPYSEYYR